jgi:hypothetical protein
VLGQSITRDGYEAPLDISYLADTVLQTQYVRRNGVTHTALVIYKRRTGAHDRGVWELHYGPGGIHVERSETLVLAAVASDGLSTEQPLGGGR